MTPSGLDYHAAASRLRRPYAVAMDRPPPPLACLRTRRGRRVMALRMVAARNARLALQQPPQMVIDDRANAFKI
jgi:hypothetical protein